MWSYQNSYEQFQSLSQDYDATHLILAKKNINMGLKKLEIDIGIPPMEEERTYNTLTSTNSYPLPERFVSLSELYVTNNSQRNYAEQVYNDEEWGQYQLRPSQVVNDNLTHVFIRQGLQRFEVYPLFATASLVMTMIYQSFTKDLSAADYTTGTITTLANGGTAVTGSGTTFTAAMVGRWLKTDDGNWYKISGYTSATAITLLMPYQGTAISAGSSTFTIGELPRIPEGTHELPVYYTLWQHFAGVKRDPKMAAYYKALWDEGRAWAKDMFSKRYSTGLIKSARRSGIRIRRNPNDYPDLSSLA